jgi:small subunit ribosomal protein S20
MPNTKSAEKRVRQSKKRYLRNKAWKEKVKALRKDIIKYVLSGNVNIEELKKKWREFQSTVDKTKTKNVFKPNKVSRLKSRLLAFVAKHGVDISKIAS